MPSVKQINILSLDTAATHTGFAVFRMEPETFNFKIPEFGCIDTDSSMPLEFRIRHLLSEVMLLRFRHGINCFVIEHPEMFLISQVRAISLCKVFASCYGIIGLCYANGIHCRKMTPKEWQPTFSKKKNKGAKSCSKAWSVQKANSVLAIVKSKKILKASEHHTADAINIGVQAMLNYKHGDWEMPEAEEEELT